MAEHLPHDLTAEQATLGSMILNKDAITEVSEVLKADHFYRPVHGEIFEAIASLVTDGEPVDTLTLEDRLRRRGALRRAGGAPYLVTLTSVVPTPVGAASYARIVYDRWRQRQIAAAGDKLKEIGYREATTSEEVDRLLAEADSVFRELGDPSRSGLMWDDLVDKWLASKPAYGDIIYTPWVELNEWFPGGGFRVGQLVIVGGRPGNGKSNAGLNIVLEAAEHNVPTTVFSVEMDDLEVCSRLLAAGTHSKFGQVYTKVMDDEVTERVKDYIQKKRGMPLEVIDQPYITVEKIVSHCRMRRPKCIFVDYSQLIEPTNSKLQRQEQIAHITRSLKVAAKSLKMVVVVASQLRRIDRDDKTLPAISDLRESGAAEQDADIVILLHRPGESAQVTVIVGKNRNGPTGQVKLTFRGDLARVG